jgi:hypothetical protein
MDELTLIIFCGSGILILVGYLAYRSHQFSKRKMVLNKGGIIKADGGYTPDIARSDLQEFFKECQLIEIPRDFSEEFLLQLFNMSKYLEEPPAPRLADDLIKVWGIDDNVEDLINPILTRRKLQKIRWDDTKILELRTMGDVLSYTYLKTQGHEIDG